jgi:hypothetical protein
MQQAYKSLIDIFDQLIHEAQGDMYEYINFKQDKIVVSAPQFIIDEFKKALSMVHFSKDPRSIGKDFVYRGLKFQPCYEMEISVWHIDYPLYKKDWMLRKMPLSTPFITQHEPFRKYVIELKPLLEYFNIPDNSRLN